MTRTKNPTATEQFFANDPEYIIERLFEHHCMPSFSTRESMVDWYATLPYSDKTMEIIMQETVIFLRLLDSRDSRSTCPQLLFALNAKIAKYLSAYKMRGNHRILSGEKLNQKSLNKIQAKANAELKEQLDNCSYIKSLLKKQEMQRAARSAGQRKQAAQRRKAKEAFERYNMACQVRAEFRDMQNVPRKSR